MWTCWHRINIASGCHRPFPHTFFMQSVPMARSLMVTPVQKTQVRTSSVRTSEAKAVLRERRYKVSS